MWFLPMVCCWCSPVFYLFALPPAYHPARAGDKRAMGGEAKAEKLARPMEFEPVPNTLKP
jgi:hypothetical protein